jgi:hypothetical protein
MFLLLMRPKTFDDTVIAVFFSLIFAPQSAILYVVGIRHWRALTRGAPGHAHQILTVLLAVAVGHIWTRMAILALS